MQRIKKYAAIVAFWVASLVSCSTASAFTGPVSDKPTIALEYRRHFVQDDPRLPSRVETITTAAITNPSAYPMTVTLDCTESLHTLTIAPRMTEHVLLDRDDRECTLSQP
jgi:hypothetical protein